MTKMWDKSKEFGWNYVDKKIREKMSKTWMRKVHIKEKLHPRTMY